MAHLENFTRVRTSNLLDHHGREKDDGKHRSNPNIDPSKTGENWVVAVVRPEPGQTPQGKLRETYRDKIQMAVQRTNEARVAQGKKALYSSAAVLSDWVVTLPKDCPPERMEDFFHGAVEFVVERYWVQGFGGVYGGFIHMDETTPHVHIPVIPLDKDGQLSRSKVFTRKDLQTFHDDFQAYIDDYLGIHVSVTLDDEDVLGKALSKLTREEMNAIQDQIAAEVDAQTAVERQNLQERENTLQESETALKRAKNALKSDKTAIEQREHRVEERELAVARREKTVEEKDQEIQNRQVAVTEWAKGKVDAAIDDDVMERYRRKQRQEKQAEADAMVRRATKGKSPIQNDRELGS